MCLPFWLRRNAVDLALYGLDLESGFDHFFSVFMKLIFFGGGGGNRIVELSFVCVCFNRLISKAW